MPNVKFAQKLGNDSYKRLVDQQKNGGGVFVITGVNPSADPVTVDHVIGRVTSIFNLVKKLDVYVELKNERDNKKKLEGQYRFVQAVDDKFYLLHKDE